MELLKIPPPPPQTQTHTQRKLPIMRLRGDWREKTAIALPQVELSFFSEKVFPTHYSQERLFITDHLAARVSLFKIIV